MTDTPNVIAGTTTAINPTTPVVDQCAENATPPVVTHTTHGTPDFCTTSANPESIAGLSTQVLCNADHRLVWDYSNTTHRNDGHHLTSGIANDKLWQS